MYVWSKHAVERWAERGNGYDLPIYEARVISDHKGKRVLRWRDYLIQCVWVPVGHYLIRTVFEVSVESQALE